MCFSLCVHPCGGLFGDAWCWNEIYYFVVSFAVFTPPSSRGAYVYDGGWRGSEKSEKSPSIVSPSESPVLGPPPFQPFPQSQWQMFFPVFLGGHTSFCNGFRFRTFSSLFYLFIITIIFLFFCRRKFKLFRSIWKCMIFLGTKPLDARILFTIFRLLRSYNERVIRKS